MTHPPLRFGPFTFDPDTGQLTRYGSVIPLEPLPTGLLRMLVARSGHLVGIQEIRTALWPDFSDSAFEAELNHTVRRLRAVLEDTSRKPRVLQKLPGRGYRFIAPVFRDDGRPPRSPRRRRLRLGQFALLALGGGTAAALAFFSLPKEGDGVAVPSGPATRSAYAEALEAIDANGFDDAERAIELLRRVTEAEPDFAPAHSALARAYYRLSDRVDSLADHARTEASRALVLDPMLAEAHATLALVRLTHDRDWAGAREAASEAVRTGREVARAHAAAATVAEVRGDWGAALSERRRAVELDRTASTLRQLGTTRYRARDYAAAADACEQAVELDAADQSALLCAVEAHAGAGETTQAWTAARRVLLLNDVAPDTVDALGTVPGGEVRLARFHALLASLPTQADRSFYARAREAARSGDAAAALEALRESIERGEHAAVHVGSEPAFDVLRDRPDFQALAAPFVPRWEGA